MIQKKSSLKNKTIAITRAENQVEKWKKKFTFLGAQVLVCPTIKITAPDSWDELDTVLAAWEKVDWLVFTSLNAVNYFMNRFFERGLDVQELSNKHIAAVGSSTADVLSKRGIPVDYVPEVFTGLKLAEGLAKNFSPPRGIVLVPRSQRASDDLPRILISAGWLVRCATVYTTRYNKCSEKTLDRLPMCDCITFTSPSSVKGFSLAAGKDFFQKNKSVLAASIGPVTTRELKKLSPERMVEASPHNLEGMIGVLEKYFLLNIDSI